MLTTRPLAAGSSGTDIVFKVCVGTVKLYYTKPQPQACQEHLNITVTAMFILQPTVIP
jgi:hypothetical protein